MSFLKTLFNRKTLIVWIVLIIAGVWFVRTRTTTKTQPQLATVSRGTVIETLSLSGNVTPATQANVFSSVSGTVENLAVKNGDSVSSGNTLFEVKSVDSTKKNITITAPIDGTIANLKIANGNQVVASNLGSNVPVLIIGDFSSYNVLIQVNEIDLAKVATDQKATITFDAISGKTLNGTVTQIDTVGTSTQGVVTYGVTVHVDDSDATIKTGMTATIVIETNKRENVLVVPNAAVVPYKGGKAVQVVVETANKPTQQTYREVTIGLKGTTETEILTGVTEGEKVVIGSNPVPTTSGGLFGGQ